MKNNPFPIPFAWRADRPERATLACRLGDLGAHKAFTYSSVLRAKVMCCSSYP